MREAARTAAGEHQTHTAAREQARHARPRSAASVMWWCCATVSVLASGRRRPATKPRRAATRAPPAFRAPRRAETAAGQGRGARLGAGEREDTSAWRQHWRVQPQSAAPAAYTM